MSLLLTDEALVERRAAAAGSLRPLAESLATDLEPLLQREPYFPSEKALLSREGGRCARDGTLLEFDPLQPREHRCPRCGTVYRGALHDRFWVYWYQLWLAERAVHGAVLAALGAGERYAALAERILRGYAERYATYPNVDNVLGPTRLFFSTYLESIWLLQICVAVDLMQASKPALAMLVAEQIVEPSRQIIGDYDEGGSNRQVWNDVALLAAARVLGDDRGAEKAVYGASGIAAQLAQGLLSDGTWFEGENYHLFAHRGLWYGVTLAEQAGLELPGALVDRFQVGFAAPFATALPDLTLPSRRDSQYAISLRQWRIAEHCELGVARVDDPTLLGALARMYCDDVPRRDTGRSRSSADVEHNAGPTALTRADLSWRGLLCARPVLPELQPLPPKSTLLTGQGIGVFRRDQGRAYAALDYGHSGGGHGHPDRLNLLLAVGSTRWLDDFGTGSYVDPSLHWYRSTLAHNAPLVDGRSQRRVHGKLLAFDEREAAGWIAAAADEIAPGVNVSRTVAVMPTYLVDTLEWHAPDEATVDLPLHTNLAISDGAAPPISSPLAGGSGLEDGFEFVRDTSMQRVRAGDVVQASATSNGEHAQVWAVSTTDCEWWSATAPGPPGQGDHTFSVVRARGSAGTYQIVWSLTPNVVAVERPTAGIVRVVLADGTRHEHRRTERGWHVDIVTPGRESEARTIDLAGLAESMSHEENAATDLEEPALSRHPIVLRAGEGTGKRARIALGEAHYRRSEQTWGDAGKPRAAIDLGWIGGVFQVDVEVPVSDLTFVAPSAVNRYDNEPADINGDGVQLYLRAGEALSGWMLVPEAGSTGGDVRVRQIEGWRSPRPLSATWERLEGGGYRMHIDVPSATPPDAVDVIVNEMPRGRERRRGQLVLSGGAGEFVYLRGDRNERSRLIPLRIAHG